MGRFADAAAATPARRKTGPPCSIGAFLAQLDAEDAREYGQLLTEVRDGARTWTSLARIVVTSGAVTATTKHFTDRLRYHYRGDCSCPATTSD